MRLLVPLLLPLIILVAVLFFTAADPQERQNRHRPDPEALRAARRVQAARRWALYERLAAAERDLATDLFPWDPQDWIADDMLDPDGPEMRRRRQQRSAERLPDHGIYALADHLNAGELRRHAERDREQTAMPDGSFPIENRADLRNAIRLYDRGNASKKLAVARHILKRARVLDVISEMQPLGDLPLSERARILDELDGCGHDDVEVITDAASPQPVRRVCRRCGTG